MSEWDPYIIAFENIKCISVEKLQEYIFLRLTGREADPPCNWSRNQEAPEGFLIWANSAGNPDFQGKLLAALKNMVEKHIQEFIARPALPGSANILSRLFYISEMIQATNIVKILKQEIIKDGQIRIDVAKKLGNANIIPWGETLLHQTLSLLSVLEMLIESPNKFEVKSFWIPILKRDEDRIKKNLPLNTCKIALKALGTENWKETIEKYFHYYVQHFLKNEIDQGQSELAVERELADTIYFFLLESKRQQEIFFYISRLTPTLFNDPTPLGISFQFFATEEKIITVLRGALKYLCNSPRVFNNVELQRNWKNFFSEDIIRLINNRLLPSLQKQQEDRKARDTYQKSPKNISDFNTYLFNLKDIAENPQAMVVNS
ncbi:MAG: hypothetical protein K8R67_06825 [Desulfobacteraceae bacterium]|nr:hypothetical protein [Desulfobacteraceae bacterium]